VSLTAKGPECWQIVLALDPVPAARPRVGKFGTYYPKTYSRFKLQADELLAPLAEGRTPSTELFYVNVEFIGEKPKSTILPAPKGDIDNYVKAALDAVTKAQCMWSDDRQVVGLHAVKRWAREGEENRIVITAGLTAGAVWEACYGIDVAAPWSGADIMDHFERVELVSED
jgi:Holliday junction resolvase RusA-like endonuclease